MEPLYPIPTAALHNDNGATCNVTCSSLLCATSHGGGSCKYWDGVNIGKSSGSGIDTSGGGRKTCGGDDAMSGT